MYHCNCGEHVEQFKLSLSEEDEVTRMMNAMVKEVFQLRGMPPTINKEVTRWFADKLWDGVKEGYGKSFDGIDYDTPDGEMIASLKKNIYHFSAAKNYQQLKSLSQALVGDDNKLRSWSEFKEIAYGINDQHVDVWLKTEYDTAVASAQMASKWVAIQNSNNPLLQFDAIIDGRTTDLCRSLDGVIKPANDTFWKTYYPPNHFKCRSTVKQGVRGKVTPDDKVEHPDNVPEMFKVNLAEHGLIFPPKHAYYNGLPAEVLQQGEDLMNNKEE